MYSFQKSLPNLARPSSDIILVAIDDATIKDMGIQVPLPLKFHNTVLANILDENPQLIIYPMTFHENPTSTEDGLVFKNLSSSEKTIFASKLKNFDEALENPSFISQQDIFQNGIAVDRISGAQDGVARRHVVKLSKFYSIEVGAAQKLGFIKSLSHLPDLFYTNYYGPKKTFKTVSFSKVLKKQLPANFFNNKIVFIGHANSATSQPFNTTPFDKKLYSFTNLEIHATILDNIRSKAYISKSHFYTNTSITFLASFISIVLIMENAPFIGIILFLVFGVIIYTIGFFLLTFYNTWIYTFHPLLAVFISYYILIPYRLLKENQKRIAFEKENLSLTQVEKFKTNFISLMSHDLKTPIARIHGIAEVLSLTTSGVPASLQPSIISIMESAEDLLSFVNNILNVARIESEKISLNKESKDINNIIENCIKSLSYVAKTKNITLRSDLEPLFSIKLDSHLIRQVISTLLENAIKYSPSGSTVTLSSNEHDDYIKVKITDNGRGIPENEQKLIFTKFYRGNNNNRTNPISGTGLGLYLAKYFVELHKGKIELESTMETGSTFSVYLPIRDC